MKKKLALFLLPALLVRPAYAAGQAADDFLFFQEEANVVTASRRMQPINESPVSIEVITAEDIENSGAANFWDLLRYRAGIDVMDGVTEGGNRVVVSVRGFASQFVNSLEVLVDGVSVFSATVGGVFWEQIPVQLQDIERIEVVRGPNAALYGSNAGLGVINIITKRPQGKNAFSLYESFGNRGTFSHGVTMQAAGENYGSRLSQSYITTQGGYPASERDNNSLRANKWNFRQYWAPSKVSAFEVLAGDSLDDTFMAHKDGLFRTDSQTLKYTLVTGENAAWETTVSRSEIVQSNDTDEARERHYEAESLHHFEWGGGKMQTSWGASYAYTGVSGSGIFPGRRFNEITRGFAHQTVQLSVPLRFVGGASLDKSRTGGRQDNFQFALLYDLSKRHTLRVSYSKASTIPDLFIKFGTFSIPGGPSLAGNSDIRPQKLYSSEAGYTGAWLDEALRVESSVFYMRIDDLVMETGWGPGGGPPPGPPPAVISWDNNNSATATGAELSLKYHAGANMVYTNYTYEHIDDKKGGLVNSSVPGNKLNLGTFVKLSPVYSCTVNAGYKDIYSVRSAFGEVRVPAYWRVDARLARKFGKNTEAYLYVNNLLDRSHLEYSTEVEVARTFGGGVSLKF